MRPPYVRANVSKEELVILKKASELEGRKVSNFLKFYSLQKAKEKLKEDPR